MRPPVSLLDSDRPNPPGEDWIPRGDAVDRTLEDLAARGAAVLQGPPGSGTSALAAAVAARWEGAVAWKRAGLFGDLADLARPLWGDDPPAALQQAPVEAAVDAVLGRLRAGRLLWVLDDFDDALEPPPGPASPRDPDVGVLLAALEAGALAASGAAVLVVTRRSPRGRRCPPRPPPGWRAVPSRGSRPPGADGPGRSRCCPRCPRTRSCPTTPPPPSTICSRPSRIASTTRRRRCC